MAAKPLPSQEYLRQCFRYEPETGKLFWRKRAAETFRDSSHGSCASFNIRYAGYEAFAADSKNGYKVGRLGGSNYYAHRVIWKMNFGDDPDFVDHINGDPSDNRINNLRNIATHRINMLNVKRRTDNTSGVTGVGRSRRRDKWVAEINVDGRHIYLGAFSALEDAAAARKAAEMEYGFHANHGRK